MNNTPKVSVIIPVYKAEPYIEKCARSLFEQTLDDIEYIFVDDCSPDDSFEILNHTINGYPTRKEMIKIVSNNTNMGVSHSRNSGLKNATGQYIIHCDSDDWVSPTMYEEMYKCAIKNDSDIVWCDYLTGSPDNLRYHQQSSIPTSKECIKSMLLGRGLKPHLWDKLVKKSVYTDNKINFPIGINIREDWVVVIELFFNSQRFNHIKEGFYHYYIREDSLSNNYDWEQNTNNVTHRIEALNLITDFLAQKNSLGIYINELNTAKAKLKHQVLLRTKNKKKWIHLFPEASDLKYLPANYSKSGKLAAWLALKGTTAGYSILNRLKQLLQN